MDLGLLDTSTVILLGRIADPATLPYQAVISAIMLAELSVGPLITSDPLESAARQAHLQQAENDFDAIAFDAAAQCRTPIARRRSARAAAGRWPLSKTRLRPPQQRMIDRGPRAAGCAVPR